MGHHVKSTPLFNHLMIAFGAFSVMMTPILYMDGSKNRPIKRSIDDHVLELSPSSFFNGEIRVERYSPQGKVFQLTANMRSSTVHIVAETPEGMNLALGLISEKCTIAEDPGEELARSLTTKEKGSCIERGW